MSFNRMFNLPPNADVSAILNNTSMQLQQQGFNVAVNVLNPGTATMVVSKNRDGFQNILGLGIECRATITLNNNMLNLVVEHEWMNKIIALAVGWIVCWIPFITGIIGCVNQNGLPDKIATAIMTATAPQQNQGNNGGYTPQ